MANRPVSRRAFLLTSSTVAVGAALSAAADPASAVTGSYSVTSGDGYLRYDATTNTWTIGTATVEKTLSLTGAGVFRALTLLNKKTGVEYLGGTTANVEFTVTANGTTYNGATGPWTLADQTTATLAQGELQLTITLTRAPLRVVRTYTVYPSTGVIRELTTYTNTSVAAISVTSPYMYILRAMNGLVANVQAQYMTGGGHFTGAALLKNVALPAGYARTFDSKDTPEVMTVDGMTYNTTGDYNQGTSVYDTLFVLRKNDTSEGIWTSFDFNGHWLLGLTRVANEVQLAGRVAMTNYSLASQATISCPGYYIGVFTGDLDDMGNTIGDFTYRYLWDYTRDGASIFLNTFQWRASPQIPCAFANANYGRYVGARMTHVDANWYDREGDWNESWAADSLADLNAYVHKSGMYIKVWSPYWHADYGSQVVTQHPDWLVAGDAMTFYGLHLNLANPDAVQWMIDKANAKQAEWGYHRWRVDGAPTWPSGGSDNDNLGMSNGILRLLKAVKDANPQATIETNASGGEMLLMEIVRYGDSETTFDAGDYHYEGYYQSLKLPFDKLQHRFYSEPDLQTAVNTLDPIDPVKAENTRKFFDLLRYLIAQGLFGRWIKVYRPTIAGGLDPTYFIQKVNGAGDKSMIIFNDLAPYTGSSITVYPKGLTPTLNYSVSFYKSTTPRQTKTGAQWMSGGVTVDSLQLGEHILFNVFGYPGSGEQTTAPGAPTQVMKIKAKYVSRYGTELTWTAPTGTAWVSYYEIFHNAVSIDKVSRGTFYFLPEGAVTDGYSVRAVNSQGLASAPVAATLATGGPNPVTPPPIPDHFQLSTSFSSVQGGGSFAYLQRDIRNGPTSYYLTNMKFDSAHNDWQGLQPYALIYPNALSPQAPYNAVVKWAAPKPGNIRLRGTIKPAQGGQGGDGVIAAIYREGDLPVHRGPAVWGPVAIPNDSPGVSYNIPVADVGTSDLFYFEVGQNANPTFDVTQWDPIIDYE